MAFPPAFYQAPYMAGGSGSLKTFAMNGPGFCVTDWTDWTNWIGIETMGSNDQVGDTPGTYGQPKRPAETQFEVPLSVVGDTAQGGLSYLTGSEVTEEDMILAVMAGYDQNMAVINALCAPISTGRGTTPLTVVDNNGWTWIADIQPLGLKVVDKPKVGYDPTGRLTQMGNYQFVFNLLDPSSLVAV